MTASNVTIRNASNLIVKTEGVTIDGNSIFIDGKVVTFFNKIDGGFNELRSESSRIRENLVDGGKDENKPLFSESIINKIDSEDGINNIV